MTSTELIKDMLERQKAYDEEVFKKHNVDYVSKSQLESALFDELGELMHAQKSDWCWWKFTQEPKDEAKVFEEYIDVVHFALMYEIKFGSGCYQDEDIKWNYNKIKTDLGFGQAYAFSCVISLTRDSNVLAYVIALGLHLGYSLEEMHISGLARKAKKTTVNKKNGRKRSKKRYGKSFSPSFQSTAHSITLDEFEAVQKQMKGLGWLDEKTEIKEARNPEVTNLEYYKDEILENCLGSLAVVKGRPKLCYKTNCNDCDFKINQKGCHNKVKDWLKQTHIKPVYKLTKFEKELLECYSDIYSFKVFNSLNGMKEKGYFKGVDDNELIGDILANCEVV